MAKIRAVIFDIGNVLIRWQPEAFFDGLIPQAQRQRLFAEVDLHAMNEAIDSGAPFRQTVYDTASRYPEHSAMIRLWHDRWADIAAPAIEGSARLNTKLRQAKPGFHQFINPGRRLRYPQRTGQEEEEEEEEFFNHYKNDLKRHARGGESLIERS